MKKKLIIMALIPYIIYLIIFVIAFIKGTGNICFLVDCNKYYGINAVKEVFKIIILFYLLFGGVINSISKLICGIILNKNSNNKFAYYIYIVNTIVSIGYCAYIFIFIFI